MSHHFDEYDDGDDAFFHGLEMPSRLQSGPRAVYIPVLGRHSREGTPRTGAGGVPVCDVFRLSSTGGKAKRAACGTFPADGEFEDFAGRFGAGDFGVSLRDTAGQYMAKGVISVDPGYGGSAAAPGSGPGWEADVIRELREQRMDAAAAVGRLEELVEGLTAKVGPLMERLNATLDLIDEQAQAHNRDELRKMFVALRSAPAGDGGDDDGEPEEDLFDGLQASFFQTMGQAMKVKEMLDLAKQATTA